MVVHGLWLLRSKVSICCLQALPSLGEVCTLLRDAFDGCFHREELRTIRLLDLLVEFVLLLGAAAVSFISMGDQKVLDVFLRNFVHFRRFAEARGRGLVHNVKFSRYYCFFGIHIYFLGYFSTTDYQPNLGQKSIVPGCHSDKSPNL